jgi:ABC-type sugar transport system ATPase subunit
MNIFSAKLSRQTSSLQLAGGGWQLALVPLLAHHPKLSEYPDQSLLAGLRPEAFSTRSQPLAEVAVRAVESLGHERLVYFAPLGAAPGADQEVLVARLSGPQAERAGQIIRLGFEPAMLHFFTKEGDVIA